MIELRNLILIGAGAFGREIKAWLPDCQGYDLDWKFKGFIDSDMSRLNNYRRSKEIISTIANYTPQDDDVFLCTVADQKYRVRYVELLKNKGAKFATIVHKTSLVDHHSKIGTGVFIAPFCTVSCDVEIKDHVLLNSNAAIGHDVVVEDYCHINSFTLLGGNVKIGRCSTVHPNSVIIPGKTVGENATVGAGSIVIRNVKSHTTVFGNPAKAIM